MSNPTRTEKENALRDMIHLVWKVFERNPDCKTLRLHLDMEKLKGDVTVSHGKP